MEFFNQAIDILKILVMALGAGLAVWGVINLLEGYGSDNPAAKARALSSSWRARCRSDRIFSLSLCCPACSAKCHPLSLFQKRS